MTRTARTALSLLPAITFICGPEGSGRRALALEIERTIPGTSSYSLLAPLRMGTIGTFFGGDPGIDLASTPNQSVPVGTPAPEPAASFIEKYHRFLRTTYSPDILAHICLWNIGDDLEYFERFVIEDGSWHLMTDIRRIVDEYGPQNCLIVNIATRSGPAPLNSDRVRCLAIETDTGEAMLRALSETLALDHAAATEQETD